MPTRESKMHRYAGKDAVVTWDEGLCMHAAECVRGAPAVFRPNARPWVDPDAASVAALSATIARCPSGALKLFRPDGTLITASKPSRNEPVAPDTPTRVKVRPDGPNVFQGDFVVVIPTPQGTRHETLAFLCRCGASENKPFCDGTHRKIGFRHPGTLPADRLPGISKIGTVTITPQPNGPLECRGPLTVEGCDGRVSARDETWLCRCGHSGSKPFCDGTHEKIGFVA